MDISELNRQWRQYYGIIPQQLQKIKESGRVFTAFNTNIDAVLKISGKKIAELADKLKMSAADIKRDTAEINAPQDVVSGIFKCFSKGIAEEWQCRDKSVYEWIQKNLGYDSLQMGGQAGIIGNTLADLGLNEVYVHSCSHPKLQAEQFLNKPNLYAFDEYGEPTLAYKVCRSGDTPLVHWIIEFNGGDTFIFQGEKYICPKANRFIATYDVENTEMKMNKGFLNSIEKKGFAYIILSGYHNLSVRQNGLQRIAESVELLCKWKKNNPEGFIHLELASTQDLKIRSAIAEKLAPLVDSIGMNDREALDFLAVIDEDLYGQIKDKKPTAINMLKVLLKLKEKLKTPRIQLHMLGIYMVLQNSDFKISAVENRSGMILASVLAATKAATGKIKTEITEINKYCQTISNYSLQEITNLANGLNSEKLATCGITTLNDYTLIAVPTILVDKPISLVGMGDTISSVSLVAAR